MNVTLCRNLTKIWYPVGELTPLWGCQSVRWRKPIWLPVSKLKEFWVPERSTTPEEEKLELRRLSNNYRTQMKSIKYYLKKENRLKSSTSAHAIGQLEEEEVEHRRMMEINRQENERMAVLREKRVREEQQAELLRVSESKRKLELERLKMEEGAIRVICETEELVKSFILKENLEKEVETAIQNPKSYSFAIDNEGSVYKGKKEEAKKEEEKTSSMEQ